MTCQTFMIQPLPFYNQAYLCIPVTSTGQKRGGPKSPESALFSFLFYRSLLPLHCGHDLSPDWEKSINFMPHSRHSSFTPRRTICCLSGCITLTCTIFASGWTDFITNPLSGWKKVIGYDPFISKHHSTMHHITSQFSVKEQGVIFIVYRCLIRCALLPGRSSP